MSNTDLHAKLLAFLVTEFARKEGRRCVSLDLLYQPPGFHEDHVCSWERADVPEFFEDVAKIEQLVSAIIEVAEDDAVYRAGPHRFVVCTHQYLGGREKCSFKLAPSAGITDISASTVATAATACSSSIHELREVLAKNVDSAEILMAMIDELALLRAKERLRSEAQPAATTNDLPPDAATGLYLDCPFNVEDFEWIKMAWDAYLLRNDGGGPPRPSQIMLVFHAIRRDERATTEFLRVMNTIMLPLLRRLRLKEQPHLTKLGAAGE